MSTELPQLSTPRLLLRALENHQGETLCALANGPKIADNTASIPSPYTLETARVMEKIGLQYEGCRRGAFFKNGVHEDMLVFATLREDWEYRL